jgi:protein-tyrosine-phosphatase
MRGPNGEELPQAVLFACTQNAVRSPIAAALMRYLYGKFCYVDSVGARAGEKDPFIAEVLDEIGIDLGKHRPKSFDDLEDASFDLIITLTPDTGRCTIPPSPKARGSKDWMPTGRLATI